MFRIAIRKSDGKLIEMQEGGKVDRLARGDERFKSDAEYASYLSGCDALEAARLDTLRQNAIASGYPQDDIEVKWISEDEWKILLSGLRTYADLRRPEYPDFRDFLDAQTKKSDPERRAEGEAQERAYLAACLAVKAKYPKPC